MEGIKLANIHIFTSFLSNWLIVLYFQTLWKKKENYSQMNLIKQKLAVCHELYKKKILVLGKSKHIYFVLPKTAFLSLYV